jgi:hypothetical protein
MDKRMSWLLRDERNMRLFRHPPQHHEPPLGWTDNELGEMIGDTFWATALDAACADCGWTLEGWEPCEEHKGDDDDR